jgi:hypothetical protein
VVVFLLFWAGDIPDDQRVTLQLSCEQAHPGVCRTRDAHHYARIIRVGESIFAELHRQAMDKSFIQLQSLAADGVAIGASIVCWVGHLRLRDPKIGLFLLMDTHRQEGMPSYLRPMANVVKRGPFICTNHSVLKRLPGFGFEHELAPNVSQLQLSHVRIAPDPRRQILAHIEVRDIIPLCNPLQFQARGKAKAKAAPVVALVDAIDIGIDMLAEFQSMCPVLPAVRAIAARPPRQTIARGPAFDPAWDNGGHDDSDAEDLHIRIHRDLPDDDVGSDKSLCEAFADRG